MTVHSAKGLLSLLLALVVLTTARGQGEAEDLIVGKWVPTRDKDGGTLEFTKKGKVHLTGKSDDGKAFDISGSYKFLGATTVEVVMTMNGESKKEKLQVMVGKDELSFTDTKKRTESFRRIR